MNRLLTSIWKHTPRPFSDHQTTEPVTYRSWKWLWQQRSKIGWKSNLFERIEESEWDLLVILDACRYDTLASVVDCAVVERAVSPASATPGFLKQANTEDLFDGTTYLSANPQTNLHPPGAKRVVDLYETQWDTELSTVTPDTVYAEARKWLKKGERVVAHTLQPHYPHICMFGNNIRPVRNGLHPTELDFLDENYLEPQIFLSDGRVSLGRARRSYELCTAYAWNQVKAFATWATSEGYTVAITADHGELFGERGFVEHPNKINISSLTTVPWIMFEPDITPTAYEMKAEPDKITDRLAALGYVD